MLRYNSTGTTWSQYISQWSNHWQTTAVRGVTAVESASVALWLARRLATAEMWGCSPSQGIQVTQHLVLCWVPCQVSGHSRDVGMQPQSRYPGDSTPGTLLGTLPGVCPQQRCGDAAPVKVSRWLNTWYSAGYPARCLPTEEMWWEGVGGRERGGGRRGEGDPAPVKLSRWLNTSYSAGYPARRPMLQGQSWHWQPLCWYTVTGWDTQCDLQLLSHCCSIETDPNSQCGSTENCPGRSVPLMHFACCWEIKHYYRLVA